MCSTSITPSLHPTAGLCCLNRLHMLSDHQHHQLRRAGEIKKIQVILFCVHRLVVIQAKTAIRCLYTIAMAEQLQPGSENPHNISSAHSAASPPAIDDFVAGLFLNDSPNREGLLASGPGFDPSSLMGSTADGLDPAMEAFLRLSEPDDIDQIHQQSEAQPQQLPFVVQPSPPPLVYQAPAYGGPALPHQKVR